METLEGLLAAWSDAEARGDAAALDALLAADFRGDGPLGFVLDKEAWLDRHRRGDLEAKAFVWIAGDLLMGNQTAVVIGVQFQVARYRGQDCSGASDCTLVAVRRNGRWTIVNLQLGHPPGPDLGQLADVRRRPRRQASRHRRRQKEAQVMAGNELQPQQPPGPDPALTLLDRFVGTWDMQGRTVDSEADNVTGRATFEWLPGGYFLQQRIELDFAGIEIKGLELIGYDPATGTFPSTVFSNLAGAPLPYRWEVKGDELTITTELLGATFHGRWSEDGSTFSGGWRPDPGREGPGNVAYDISGGRAEVPS